MNITITDEITGDIKTCDKYDMQETLEAMFDTTQYGIQQAIEDLVYQYLHGEYYGDNEAFLGISINPA